MLDPRPSLTSIESLIDRVNQSELGDSEVESEKSTRQNTRELKEEALNGLERRRLRSITMFAGDPAEQKLGWPLLRRTNSGILQTHHARDMSVVQWVMSLPDRSPKKSPNSSSSIEENPFERGISDMEDESSQNGSPPSVELPKGLEGMLIVNSLNCKWLSLEVLKSCTSHFSPGWTTAAYTDCYVYDPFQFLNKCNLLFQCRKLDWERREQSCVQRSSP